MPKLLLIEDEENERVTLARILEHNGFEVEAVGAAGEAREAMDLKTFDCVLSDVFMPGGDGLSFAREISEKLPGVPIVLMSAFPFPIRQVERMEIPRLRFLPKPVDMDGLIEALLHPEVAAPTSTFQLPSLRRRPLAPR